MATGQHKLVFNIKGILLTEEGQPAGQAQTAPNQEKGAKANATTPTPTATSAAPAASPAKPAAQSNAPKTIDDVIKESGNAEALEIKKQIDVLKQQRKTAMYNLHQSRRKLEYKEKEQLQVAKRIETDRSKIEESKRKVWKLKRSKEKLEFRISTEAKSLASEKDLIRKINEINAELEEALRYVRLDRKLNLVKGDIEQNKTLLQAVREEAGGDRQGPRRPVLQGQERARDKEENEGHGLRPGRSKAEANQPHYNQQPQQEINLEDIAVIKRK